jgi:hypothetical protein
MPMDGAAVRGMAIRVGHMPGVAVRDGAIVADMATDTASYAVDIMERLHSMAAIMRPPLTTVVDSTAAPSMAEADFMAADSAVAIGKNGMGSSNGWQRKAASRFVLTCSP